ncbi:MAG: hypothetical protein HGB10_09940 [Coriobacteriia bacterium]|nr:hypothetical protein [Coriobacteriia bacterium]
MREPSWEEFEAAEDDGPPLWHERPLFRFLWRVVAVVLIVALLLYFIVPIGGFMGSMWERVRPTLERLQVIPLAPEPVTPPKTQVRLTRPGSVQRIPV